MKSIKNGFCLLTLGLLAMLTYSPKGLCLTPPLLVAGADSSHSTSHAPASFTDTTHTKTMSNGQYIGGGVASIFLGFGIGHAIQGRWGEDGWLFTAIEGGLVVLFISSHVMMVDSALDGNFLSTGSTWGLVGLGSLIALSAVHIWEIIDAWSLPDHYKIASKDFQLSPVAYYNNEKESFYMGANLRYLF